MTDTPDTTIVKSLRQFFDAEYPKINGPGWSTRDAERGCILDFLQRYEDSVTTGGE
jgi:hypothetical protein